MRLTDGEIARLAACKGISEFDFIQQFTRLTADRQGLALLDKANGECVFLAGNECSVQAAKPQQCRDFPNRWNFPGFEKVCRAVPRRVSVEAYAELTAEATRSEFGGATNPGK